MKGSNSWNMGATTVGNGWNMNGWTVDGTWKKMDGRWMENDGSRVVLTGGRWMDNCGNGWKVGGLEGKWEMGTWMENGRNLARATKGQEETGSAGTGLTGRVPGGRLCRVSV